MEWSDLGHLLLGLAVVSFFTSPLVDHGVACWRARRIHSAAIRRRAEEDRCLRQLLGSRPG